MDVFVLSESDYSPIRLVDGLHSKIWTERFKDLGEFEFRSSAIEQTMSNMPEGSFVSLRDTDQVMRVETHSIEKDGESGYVLLTKGRACESIIEKRVFSDAKYGKKIKMQKQYSIQNAILVYLWDSLCNDLGRSVIINSTFERHTDNVLPSFRLTDSTISPGDVKTRRIENGDRYTQLKFWMEAGHFGFRSIRPRPGQIKRKTAYVTTSGAITKPLEGIDEYGEAMLVFDLYEGTDRTIGNAAKLPEIVFAEAAQQITDTTYLFSSQNYKNVAIVVSASGPYHGKEVFRPPSDSGGRIPPRSPVGGSRGVQTIAPGEPYPGGGNMPNSDIWGWNRKELFIDAGTKDDDETTTEFLADLDNEAEDTLTLEEHDRQSIFDGTINPNVPYKYKVDYNLGDKVTMVGNYGLTKAMQVQEYIRTEDLNGEQGYPALVLWT